LHVAGAQLDGHLRRYGRSLSAAELAQSEQIRSDRQRVQFVLTRGVLRSILSFYQSGIPPRAWAFETNAYGKPRVARGASGVPPLFNVSHADGLIAIALAESHEVGVDVERVTEARPAVQIADRFFSPVEAEQLRSLPLGQVASRFFDLWTLKEAFIKARGRGLSAPLAEVFFNFTAAGGLEFGVDPGSGERAEDWVFWRMTRPKTHRVALAIRMGASSMLSVRVREIGTPGDPFAGPR
jgi:4'-phosphopantetheinyl transferase